MSRFLIDLHTHSSFSPDAKDSMEDMCKRAQELGLSAYAVTDHCDCNFWHSAEHYFDDPNEAKDPIMYGAGEYALKSIKKQAQLRDMLSDKLNFLVGIELGQPLQYLEKAEEIVSCKELDFVIGSHHQNRDTEDFYFLEYNKMDLKSIYALLDDFFAQMLEMCRWGKFDVLGHLTYPLRYICGDYGIEVDLSRWDELIRKIFTTLISKGKGVEINTSGLRQKYGRTFPELEYVKLFRTMGGEIITIGSDAHCTADIGKGISQGIDLAESAGFKYVSFFKERKAHFIKI